MHRSRLCAVLIDCKTSDVDEAARFWSEALGRPVDKDHPSSRGNYRMLETPPDEPIVEVQLVDHESRVHLHRDRRHPRRSGAPGEAGRKGGQPPGALGGDAGADRPALLRRTGAASRLPKECQFLGLSRVSAICGRASRASAPIGFGLVARVISQSRNAQPCAGCARKGRCRRLSRGL
jgi:catechol 2,3-dioxygenase-like lactoylglutathione lyase family enzyme